MTYDPNDELARRRRVVKVEDTELLAFRAAEPRVIYTAADMKDPARLAAILNQHADQLDAMVQLQEVADKIWRVVKWGTPIMIGALLASGVVTGPLAKVLSFLADRLA